MPKSLIVCLLLFATSTSQAATLNYVVSTVTGSHFGRTVSEGQGFAGTATLTTVEGALDEFNGARFDVLMSGVNIEFSDTGSVVQVVESFFAIGTGGAFGFTLGGHTIESCVTIQGPDRCGDYNNADELLQGRLSPIMGGINFFLDMQGSEPVFPDGPAFYTRDINLIEVAAPVPVPAAFWLLLTSLGVFSTFSRAKSV